MTPPILKRINNMDQKHVMSCQLLTEKRDILYCLSMAFFGLKVSVFHLGMIISVFSDIGLNTLKGKQTRRGETGCLTAILFICLLSLFG